MCEIQKTGTNHGFIQFHPLPSPLPSREREFASFEHDETRRVAGFFVEVSRSETAPTSQALGFVEVDTWKLSQAGSGKLKEPCRDHNEILFTKANKRNRARCFCFSATSGAAEHRRLQRVRAGLRWNGVESQAVASSEHVSSPRRNKQIHTKDNNHLRRSDRRVAQRPVAGEKRREPEPIIRK
jgi:hypothetical protein